MEEILPKLLKHRESDYLSKLGKENITTLTKYEHDNLHLKKNTRDLRLRALMNMAVEIGKPFKEMTKQDIEQYFYRLSTDPKIKVKPYTKETKRMIITLFFKWFYNINDRYQKPEIVSGLKHNPKAYDKSLDPKALWSEKEIKQLVEACDSPRDKAIIMILYDAGCRISELTSMDIGDVHFEGDVCFIYLPKSKTQKRRVGLIYATPYLKNWIDQHPYKAKEDAPLFISFSSSNYGHRLADCSSLDMLKRTARRIGSKKKINNHLLRHCSISKERKAGMKDHFIRHRHGLKKGSAVLERYTWFADKEVYDDYRQAMGHEPLEPVRENAEVLKPITCICGAENPCDARFCHKCHLPLKHEALEHDLNLLEMFRSNFARSAELDELFQSFKTVKSHTPLLILFQQCFNGNRSRSTEDIRRYFREHSSFSDEVILELFGVLKGYSVIDVVGDKVLLTDEQKLNRLIDEHKHLVQVGQ